MKLRILSRDDIRNAVNMDMVMDAVEFVYKSKAEGKAIVWPTVFHDFDVGHQDMDIKSGYIGGKEVHGLKMINWTEANIAKGLPALVGLILIFDTNTGLPLGLLDADFITGMRTGCAAAIGAKYLARPNSRNLMMLGTGHQSPFLICALLKQFPMIETVYVVNPIEPEDSVRYAKTIRAKLMDELHFDAGKVIFKAVCGERELAAAVTDSDIIATVTPARKPVIKKEWVKPGTHFSCIGADMSGKEEIEPEIFADAIVYCDDKVQCSSVGEMEIPLKMGILSPNDIVGEIGSLIIKKTHGRTDDNEITIYDATGMALLDLAAAKVALDLAEKAGIGQVIDI